MEEKKYSFKKKGKELLDTIARKTFIKYFYLEVTKKLEKLG